MTRCKNNFRRDKLSGECLPKKMATYHRCPNGTRKNKQGVCISKQSRKCPNGSRRNKATGNCDKKSTEYKIIRQVNPVNPWGHFIHAIKRGEDRIPLSAIDRTRMFKKKNGKKIFISEHNSSPGPRYIDL